MKLLPINFELMGFVQIQPPFKKLIRMNVGNEGNLFANQHPKELTA
jgi:hypothetical protein